MIFFAILVLLSIYFVFRSIIIVRPGQRLIVWKRVGENAGRVRVLEAGAHFVNAVRWGLFGQGPFVGLIKTFPWYVCPVPLSSVFIDPDRIEIMSTDGVPGHANVALELQLLDWNGSDIVGINVPFRTRACVIVNQWVSNQLGRLDAAKLCSYAQVVSFLNDNTNIKLLNEELKECFLEAKRISVDPSGIQLHEQYSNTIGKEIQHRRLISLQRLEAQANEELQERKLKLQYAQVQADCEQTKLRAEMERFVENTKAESFAHRAESLINAGLTNLQTANILVSEVASVGVSRAEKVLIGLPQGLIGLRGVENIMNGPHSDNYVKV